MPALTCIGCGNMGSAILGGLAARLDGWELTGYNRSQEKMRPLEKLGIRTAQNIGDAAKNADMIIFAVKPYQMAEVLRKAAPVINMDSLIVSVAAGFSLASMREALGSPFQLARCMPTTTALAGRGIFAFCFGENVKEERRKQLLTLFGLLGYCLELAENKFTDFSALIGAGPAYVFSMMQGLVQAGVTLGFSHQQSGKMVRELFGGCAALAEKEHKHLLQLRDEVCSPGGLTIAGVNVLDRAGLSGLIVEAALAAAERGREMES